MRSCAVERLLSCSRRVVQRGARVRCDVVGEDDDGEKGWEDEEEEKGPLPGAEDVKETQWK